MKTKTPEIKKADDDVASQTSRNIKRYCDVLAAVVDAVDNDKRLDEAIDRDEAYKLIFTQFFTDQNSAKQLESYDAKQKIQDRRLI